MTSVKKIVAAMMLAGVVAVPVTIPMPAEAAKSSIVDQVKVDYEKFTLPNGLRVIVHEDHSTPSVYVGVYYGVVSKDEPQGKTGFAHLF